jgi:hypothetical protein
MPDSLRELVRPVVSGSHARRHGLKLLRRSCLVTLVAIAVQFSLGMILNLYVPIPSADAHASWLREVATAPAALTAHAIIGLLLLVSAIVVVIQAIAVRSGALIGAFAAGEVFVKNSNNVASLTMSILASVALLCYATVQAIASAKARQLALSPQP